MVDWIKKHSAGIISIIVCFSFLLYVYGCEPKTKSLLDSCKLVNRKELQIELDMFINTAKVRMADLDKQEALRNIILQNALVIVEGQPFNPVGILTGLAAIYGITQGGRNVTKVVKNGVKKKKV